nr:MAG TPA: hypothetical protein [Caudoviricetes sp.]
MTRYHVTLVHCLQRKLLLSLATSRKISISFV